MPWARAELRRRWPSLVALGLLAAAASGLALAGAAGARRSDTAFERFRVATLDADAFVFASQVDVTHPDWDLIDALPEVVASGAFAITFGTLTIDGEAVPDANGFGVFAGAHGGLFDTVDRPLVREGRRYNPSAVDEVVVNEAAADRLGIEVGDVIEQDSPTAEQLFAGEFDPAGFEGPSQRFTVVGVAQSGFDISFLPDTPLIFATPGFYETFTEEGGFGFENLLVRLRPGTDLAAFEADAARALGVPNVPLVDVEAISRRVTTGTSFERDGLWLFAAAVALAGLVAVQQALSRSVRAAAGDAPTLLALGFDRAGTARAVALPHLVVVAVATIGAAAVALALSPRFPIGLSRQVEVDPGWHADWPVVGAGAVATGLVMAVATAVSSWRAVRGPAGTPPRIGGARTAAVGRGLGPVAGIGIGFALDAGRGRRALPTRPAIGAAVAAVLGLVGAAVLLSGLDDAVADPARVGTNWDVEVSGEFGGFDDAIAAAAPVLEVPGIDRVAVTLRSSILVDGVTVPTYALRHLTPAPLDFVVVEGRPPTDDDEVVLGPATAEDLGVGVGDRIGIGDPSGRRLEAAVVGIGFLPTTPHTSYDQGAWLTEAGIDAAGAPDPDVIVLVDSGTGRHDAVLAGVTGALAGVNATVGVPESPPVLDNFRNVRPLPLLFAAFTALLGIAAVAHVSSSVLRRRRGEIAVLRAIGFTPRQVRWTFSWQATAVGVIGVLVGVPLGLVVGRATWRAIAEETPMLHVAPVATLSVALAALGTLAAANLLATWPGHRASRLRPAEVLRTE